MATPNPTAHFALRHPVAWVLSSALVTGAVGVVAFDDLRVAALGAAGVGGLNAYLWRPHGRGRRWVERGSSD
jgi:membrane protein implicated in regulation of membrane protease activity